MGGTVFLMVFLVPREFERSGRQEGAVLLESIWRSMLQSISAQFHFIGIDLRYSEQEADLVV